MKIDRYHWRHYFGGVGLFLLILQVFSGIFLILFYVPHLKEAYPSVQYLYKTFSSGAWIRDSHRWIAFFLFVTIIVHIIRSLLRTEFLNNKRKFNWLTGTLLILPLMAMLVTGLILPWEWKAYWWMEMMPNYFGHLPLVGPAVKQFLIDAFTMNRNFVAHILILPIVMLILIEFHILASLRKRKAGIWGYLKQHAIVAIPIIGLVLLLAFELPMPTSDPEIIPMPLDGEYLPAPEYFFLIFFVPFIYFKNIIAPLLGLYLPLAIFVVLMLLPYYFSWRGRRVKAAADITAKETEGEAEDEEGGTLRLFRLIGLNRLEGRIAAFLTVFVISGALFGLLYKANYRSPTLGCNSCHNVLNGVRMGIPPEAFKDRNKVPLLEDSQWMSEHWFVPQLVW